VRDFETNQLLVTEHESDFRMAFDGDEENWNLLSMEQTNNPRRAADLLMDPDFRNSIELYNVGRPFKDRIDKITKARRMIRFNANIPEEDKRKITMELTVAIAGISRLYNQARHKVKSRQRTPSRQLVGRA